MKTITAIEASKSFNHLISLAKEEPIIIKAENQDEAVILSSLRYKELKEFEDILYGTAAEIEIEEGLAS